jgi:hypothetical protein
MKISDLMIGTEELIPPIANKYRYAAKVSYLYVEDESGRRKINHQFGEMWGVTESEARKKVEAAVNAWLMEQTK